MKERQPQIDDCWEYQGSLLPFCKGHKFRIINTTNRGGYIFQWEDGVRSSNIWENSIFLFSKTIDEWDLTGFDILEDSPEGKVDKIDPTKINSSCLLGYHMPMQQPLQLAEKGMEFWICCKKCGKALNEFRTTK